MCESPVSTDFLIECGTERPCVLPVCYRTAGCVTGVLPNYRVCYRTNGCFTGVNDRLCYRTTGLVAGVLPGDRAGYRRVAERQGATGVLPDNRVCYRTTGCVTE